MGWNLPERKRRLNCIKVRLNADEFESVMHSFSKSTCTELAQYLRAKALGHTVHIKYRNESLDHFLTEMVPLKEALVQIARGMDRAGGLFEAKDKTIIHEKIDQVLEKLVEIYRICSSESE
ncbi:MAG: hypothetical protein Q8937_16955 [Bacteroidota bacterium]|nr:hypothetical protein [Bacteroidota bacterium]